MLFSSIVILTGAGLSAESGLGTFRDKGRAVEKSSISKRWQRPKASPAIRPSVHEFYNLRRRRLGDARPNAAHHALARLEKEHAGERPHGDAEHRRPARGGRDARNLIHMHGELAQALCARMSARAYPWDRGPVHRDVCAACGQAGAMRPDVVWFGEMPARWTASTRRSPPATCSSRSAPAAASIRRHGVRRGGARRRRAYGRAQSRAVRRARACSPRRLYGPATEVVPGLRRADCCAASARDARRPRYAARTGTGRPA